MENSGTVAGCRLRWQNLHDTPHQADCFTRNTAFVKPENFEALI